MDPTSATVAGALNTSIKIGQFLFELNAVDQSAKDLLETTGFVTSTLKPVRALRRQKSHLLSTVEKAWIDETVTPTAERAVQAVAKLIEPSRVDMMTHQKVGLKAKMLFVLKDQPSVNTNLARLNIAVQGLVTAMQILSSKENSGPIITIPVRPTDHKGSGNEQTTKSPPPSYHESELSEIIKRRRSSRRDCNPSGSVATSEGGAKQALSSSQGEKMAKQPVENLLDYQDAAQDMIKIGVMDFDRQALETTGSTLSNKGDQPETVGKSPTGTGMSPIPSRVRGRSTGRARLERWAED